MLLWTQPLLLGLAAFAALVLSAVLPGAGEKLSIAPETFVIVIPETAEALYKPVSREDWNAPAGRRLSLGSHAESETLKLQVALDVSGFPAGPIDGTDHFVMERAIGAFQESRGLEKTGYADAATLDALGPLMQRPALRTVRVPHGFATDNYGGKPVGLAAKVKPVGLNYNSIWERLGERFHASPTFLARLNPEFCSGAGGPSAPDMGTTSLCNGRLPGPGTVLRVPNIDDRLAGGNGDSSVWNDTLSSLAVYHSQPHVEQIVVDDSDGLLRAYGKKGRLVAAFPVTTGGTVNPLAIGDWSLVGVGRNPVYSYNARVLGYTTRQVASRLMPPGPNGPVGVVWIGTSKPHIGIHGSPNPETISRTSSNGCVRLTNWSAARLAQMVDKTTKIRFQK